MPALTTLDALGVTAMKVVFWIVALAPPTVVLIYRWQRVRARRDEISRVMTKAFGRKGDPANTAEQIAAREALDQNPYISDLDVAFNRCHSPRQYVFPLLLLTVLTAAFAALGYAWVRIQLEPAWAGGPIARLPQVILMALAGGYVWSLYQLTSRIRSDELGPDDLYEINLGLLAAVPIGYAFSLLTLEASGLRSFGAFAASAFPLRETSRLVQEFTIRKMLGGETARTVRPAERHLGVAIDGVSDQTLVRLSELRIVTVLDMAYSDPIRIMLNTGFALPLIIDWMDQSIWALYAGDLRGALIRHGVRCSLDVYEFVELHRLWNACENRRGEPSGPDKQALDALAAAMTTDPNLLHDLFLRIYSDPQVVVLRRLWYVDGAPQMVRS
jgi:hypothetical protein